MGKPNVHLKVNNWRWDLGNGRYRVSESAGATLPAKESKVVSKGGAGREGQRSG